MPRARNKKSPAQTTIAACVEAWAKGQRHSTPTTVAKDIIGAFGHLAPHQLNPLMTGALIATWRKRHKPSTAYNYRGILKQVTKLLEGFGAPHIHLPKVPFGHQRAIVATGDELGRLLASPAPWLKLFILLYLQCGLRRAEALAVTTRSWKPEQHTVTIKVKGGRTRTAEVTEDVERLLEIANPSDPDQPLVEALHGKRIGPVGVNKAWQIHKRLCGVSPLVTAHDLRRTAASIVYSATKDLRIAQQLLGHRNLTSTLRYIAPLAPDEARKYAELLRFDHFKSEVKQ